MNQLEQKPGPKWWKATEGYRAYYLREYSGILIAVWGIFYLQIPERIFGLTITNQYYIYALHAIGLLGAIIHSSTWLTMMPKLLPLELNERQQQAALFLLILVWLGVSAFTLKLLWM